MFFLIFFFIFTNQEVVMVVVLVLWFDDLKTYPNFLTTQQKDFSIAAMMTIVLSKQVMLLFSRYILAFLCSIGNRERPENKL